MAVATDPFADILDQIEAVAARDDLSDGERKAVMRGLRDRLAELQGRLARYLNEDRAVREGMAGENYLDEEHLRANATLRQAIIDRKLATPEELDQLGLFSHEDLDKLAEEGLLEEAINFLERLHPRDRSGKWTEKFGGLLQKNLSSPHPPEEPMVQPRRPRIPRQRREPRIPGATGTSNLWKAGTQVEVTAGRHRGKKGTVFAHHADGGVHVDLHGGERIHLAAGDMRKDTFAERKATLEQQTKEHVATGSATAFTDAERHFNDAGKVSQRTLAQYVDRAATQPQTIDSYSSVDANGNRVWDESRRQLHEQIIDRMLRQRVFDPSAKDGKGDWVLDDSAPPLQPSESPSVLFSGGGYASGKSSALKINRARGGEPESGYDGPPLVLDPDHIKAQLPEYQDALGTDPEANMRVYQEAWAIAQETQARAQERKLNMVVDGISNTSPDEMTARAQSFLDRGYAAKAIYVDIPTDEALRRSAERAQNATDPADRRHIPEIIMRSVHRDVAATVPNLARRVREKNIPLEIEVWDNNQGQDAAGGFRPPIRYFHYADGVETVEDQALWDAFVNKAHERIVGVDA